MTTRALHVLVLLGFCLVAAGCHDEDAIRVAALDFEGEKNFDESQLRQVMETKKGGRWPWSRWRPFDELAFERDLERLRSFYQDRGYDEATVRASRIELAEDRKTIRLEITITEGAPIVIASSALKGAEALPADLVERLGKLDVGVGDARDVGRLTTARDTARTILRDNGYPHATVELQESDAAEPRSRDIVMVVDPGPETRFGDLTLQGLSLTKHVVPRRAMTFKPGDLYREREVLASQRRLARIPAFQFAHVAPEEKARAAEAPVLPMVVTVAEAKPHRFEIGVGYGSEERFRGSFEYRNVNFFGNGSQWTGTAKYSSVLRGGEFGYDHPYLLPTGGTLSARAGAWWTRERTFRSRSAGGQVGISHAFGSRGDMQLATRYRNEFLTYQVHEESLEDFEPSERIALGLDPVTGRGKGTVAGLQVSALRTAVNQPTDPTLGTIIGFTAEHVAPWLGGTFRFNELSGEVRGYAAFTGSVSVAAQVRASAIVADAAVDVPFSERYFLGGASTLRGWGRFEVSPLTSDGVPIGGHSLLLGSAEIRADVWGPVGAVVFIDAGNVWSGSWDFTTRDLRYSAGGGLRYQSLVGVVRADVGYQLNPIANLRIDGKAQSRRWRLHLSIGHAF